ncbi:ribokinase [Streptococcus varani]|uniref:Ribokinase n=1 Tax=Streptococcus varani TaxID=1608583 RepID=A0A0E3WF34_9STRE|nr:ribokinase [Streptococcus varani]CQR24788.1 ribokinase [Streptococcus varani]
MSKIVIIGSISMDLVMETSRIAQEGETVFGDRFSMVPGGKGANQAVAVGRLASKEDHITMLGAVGQDSYGPILLQNLEENGVSTAFVGTVPQSSGVAQITIFNQDNRIIYCPGANGTVDTDKWDKEWEGIAAADLVILQNEIPHEPNLAIAQFCSEKGVKVLYNPGPARSTDKEMIDFVHYLTPNEHECQEIFGQDNLEQLLKQYPNKLICTLGAKGSVFFDGTTIQEIPAIPAKVVDTTGAGDTFNGALGLALTKKMPLEEALKFASLASHLSVEKFGAQGGMPRLEEMKEHPAYEEKWNLK